MYIEDFLICRNSSDTPISISYEVVYKKIYSIRGFYIDRHISGHAFLSGFDRRYKNGKRYSSINQNYDFLKQKVAETFSFYRFEGELIRKSKLPEDIEKW